MKTFAVTYQTGPNTFATQEIAEESTLGAWCTFCLVYGFHVVTKIVQIA